MRLWLMAVGFLGMLSASLPAAEPVWQSLLPAIRTEDAVAGRWTKTDDRLRVAAASEARIVLPVAPTVINSPGDNL